jgi:hypothetical protein
MESGTSGNQNPKRVHSLPPRASQFSLDPTKQLKETDYGGNLLRVKFFPYNFKLEIMDEVTSCHVA